MLLTVTGIPKDVEMQKYLTSIHVREWLEEDVFRLRWWFLVGLIAALLAVWWILARRSGLRAVCLYAALATVMVQGIFEYGEELVLVEFPTDVIPIYPPLSSINMISLPLVYSLAYRRFKTRKGFYGAAAIITAAMCFAVEPLLSWGGFYLLLHWKYFLSFPVYFGMAVLVREVALKIDSITGSNSRKKTPEEKKCG